MKRFLNAARFWASLSGPGRYRKRVWRWLFQFGDWCASEGYIKDWMAKGPEIATAYFANSCALMGQIAAILGETEDQARYEKLRREICAAYLHQFTDGYGRLKKEFQTAYVLPLYFNIAQGQVRAHMADHLSRLVREADWHLTTGFPGTPYLLFALADNGHAEDAYVIFSLTAKEGQKVKLRFGERLDKNGDFTQKNIQYSNKKITTPLQQVEYICKDGRNDYKTTFAVFGFQYVLVEGDISVNPADFTAVAIYSDLERTGWFDCSNQLLNKFFECTFWSAKNNSADVPTDCPTRERQGWTGDAQIFCTTASYLQNYMPLARKYIKDMADTQRKNGCVSQIAPNGASNSINVMDGSPGWSDAVILIPYRLYKQFGDTEILRENYGTLKKYVQFLMNRCGKWYPTAKPTGVKGKHRKFLVNAGQSYGEWAEPSDVCTFHWTDFVSPHPEVSTAYTAYVMEIMEEIAVTLDKPTDAAQYRLYTQGSKKAYQALRRTSKFPLDTDRQALRCQLM